MLDWMERPHRRRNPLTGDWVLVSPQRALRPWQGHIEVATEAPLLRYDPNCYLCPGNERARGIRNPSYTSTFVFDNDFPALTPEGPAGSTNERGLLIAESERGICRVVCFSPRHDLTVSRMETESLTAVVETWCEQTESLQERTFVRHVQIFENRGALMGASNPHPHCQIWASESIPNEIAKEADSQGRYFDEHHACLLCEYAAAERNRERAVCENESFLAVVPFWAVWPFEVLVISTRHVHALDRIDRAERRRLGEILRAVTRRYDALFGAPFPYTMGFHQRPVDGVYVEEDAWHLHAHFYPPLLRSAAVRKFMVGYEMLAMPQRDFTPEMAAARLRECLT